MQSRYKKPKPVIANLTLRSVNHVPFSAGQRSEQDEVRVGTGVRVSETVGWRGHKKGGMNRTWGHPEMIDEPKNLFEIMRITCLNPCVPGTKLIGKTRSTYLHLCAFMRNRGLGTNRKMEGLGSSRGDAGNVAGFIYSKGAVCAPMLGAEKGRNTIDGSPNEAPRQSFAVPERSSGRSHVRVCAKFYPLRSLRLGGLVFRRTMPLTQPFYITKIHNLVHSPHPPPTIDL